MSAERCSFPRFVVATPCVAHFRRTQVDDNELLYEAVLNALVEVLGKLLSNGVTALPSTRAWRAG